jgi:hypothetical protein
MSVRVRTGVSLSYISLAALALLLTTAACTRNPTPNSIAGDWDQLLSGDPSIPIDYLSDIDKATLAYALNSK